MYSVQPSTAQLAVSVDRTGGSTGVAYVSYATANGSAVAGTDYTPTSGTLQWNDGDSAPKQFNVAITKRAGADKHFSVHLTTSSGATLGTVTAATVTIAPASGSVSSTLAIQVQGAHLVDASGNEVQLRGVNVSGLEGAVHHHGSDWADAGLGGEPNWGTIKTWGTNAVRLPLNESSWLSLTGTDADNGATNQKANYYGTYQASVINAVNHATAAGLYVILDLHWTAPGPFIAMNQAQMADTDHALAFWTSIADTFKNNPAVIFELFNEPFGHGTWPIAASDWATLRDGGTYPAFTRINGASTAGAWTATGMQAMLNAVRATGASNVVLVGSMAYDADLSQWLAYKPTDPLAQIAAVWHAYPGENPSVPTGGKAQYGYAAAILAAGYPIVITEFGGDNSAGAPTPPLLPKLLPWADTNKVGYTAWTWNPWTAYSKVNVLIKDTAGTATDGYGEYVKAHFLCRATGNARCP
jgi:aryl-phospho-beta-D-glucosidase BglC (GH1 family)